MKNLLLGSLAVFTVAATADEIAHRPETGVEVSKHFSSSSEMSLVAMTMIVDGEEMPEMGDVQQSMSHSSSFVVVDTVTAVDDEGVLGLSRSFEEIAANDVFEMADPMGGDFGHDFDLESELVGHEVQFTRGDEGFEADFAEGDTGESELLEDLVALVELTEFLPEGPVEVGDSWELEPDVLGVLDAPAGDLALKSEDGDDPMGMAAAEEAGDLPESDLEGTVTLEYLGLRKVEGVQLAAMSIQVDVSESVDMTEFVTAQQEATPDDVPEGMMVPDISFMVEETDREGEGLLLWNVEAGRLHSLELSLDVTQTHTVGMVMDFGGTEQEMEQIMEMEGTEEFEVTFHG